jgi:hypothetical protein
MIGAGAVPYVQQRRHVGVVKRDIVDMPEQIEQDKPLNTLDVFEVAGLKLGHY